MVARCRKSSSTCSRKAGCCAKSSIASASLLPTLSAGVSRSNARHLEYLLVRTSAASSNHRRLCAGFARSWRQSTTAATLVARPSPHPCSDPRTGPRTRARKPHVGHHANSRCDGRCRHHHRPDPVADLLRQAGIDPAKRRKKGMDWKTFLKAHWETLHACDFFSMETLGVWGPVRHMVFFVIEVHSRRIQIAGIHR
jgi:hypothetical protein